MSWNEVEDGMGFAGLVPTAAERREGSEVKRLGDRIVALTKERDDYILKQKVWEAANDELRSEHIRMTARIRELETALRGILIIADRRTVEFDAAWALLPPQSETEVKS